MSVFDPNGATVTISGSTSSANAALVGKAGLSGGFYEIVNPNSAVAYVAWGVGSAPTATSSDYPVMANSTKVIAVPGDATHVAVLLSTGTGNVHLTPGTVYF